MLEYDIKLLTKPQPDRKWSAGEGRRYCWPNVKLIDFAGIQSTGHPSPPTRCLFCTENVEVFSTRPRFSLQFFCCCIFVVSVGITKILTKRFLLLIIILIILNKQLIMQSSLREFAEGNKEVRVKRGGEGRVLA